MEIKDIIKTDYDRLFIVDPECYIIFTGDSTEDVQPFIRIGNWIDMPVELIPLIENIIITDNIIGNPAHEQFNIDIRYLSTNRYIGSKNIVNKFLDFQKISGLTLKMRQLSILRKIFLSYQKKKTYLRKISLLEYFIEMETSKQSLAIKLSLTGRKPQKIQSTLLNYTGNSLK